MHIFVLFGEPGPFTIFAPTDEAFKTMRPDVKQYLKDNPKMLPILLLNHVIGNKLETNKLENEMAIKSLAQENLRFNINEKNSAKVQLINTGYPLKYRNQFIHFSKHSNA